MDPITAHALLQTNWDRGWNIPIFLIMKIMHLVRLMKRSTFDPESIFSRSFRLLQTERTSRSIQIHPVELNWDKRRSCHDLNSSELSSSELSSTFVRPSSNVAFLSRRIQCKLARTMFFAHLHWIRRDRNATFELGLTLLINPSN